ncbi:MAG: hypothetical protein A2017_18310 [Lentisphaerae bacterium GWF2_44_16]|nr:MAG: hypothetical protein A2017_18310 [Lentisphaerae bacterium GWF2_44_16]
MSLTGTISGSEIKAYGDYLWKAEALPNNTNKTSEAFLLGKAQNAIDLVVEANTNISIADSKQLKLEILAGETEDGDFESVATIYDRTASGTPITFTAGDEIARYTIPSNVGPYIKIKATTTADESSEKITVYPAFKAR